MIIYGARPSLRNLWPAHDQIAVAYPDDLAYFSTPRTGGFRRHGAAAYLRDPLRALTPTSTQAPAA